MSGNPESLRTVAHQKEQDEAEAARVLGAAQRRVDDEVGRLEAVEHYAEEYRTNTHGRAARPQQLWDSQTFYLQLQQTLDAQTEAVAGAREQAESARSQWLAARLERKVLEKLIERRHAALRQLERRSEQRLQDDQRRALPDYGGDR